MLSIPVEIKELLHQDTCHKNIRIHFPNGERSDICNDLIIKDSVYFKESLCSQSALKFGLCESPMFECEVVNVGNITGALIEVYCEIYCNSNVSGCVFKSDLDAYVYIIPYGKFTVLEAKRQADAIRRKILAYNYTARTNYESPIMELKAKMGFNSTEPYRPGILASVLMLNRFTNRLGFWGYTELTPTLYSQVLYEQDTDSINLTVTLNFKCIQLSTSNYEYLFYFDVPTMSKSDSEISSDCVIDLGGGNSLYWPAEKCLDIFKHCGLYYSRNITEPLNKYFVQKGNYIYMYQAIKPEYMSTDAYQVYVPYSITMNVTGDVTLEKTCVFRDVDDIKIYKVEMTDYIDRLYIPRDIKKSNGTYTYDSTKIDFLKAFEGLLEAKAVFGVITRDDSLKIVNLKQQFGLVPDEDLYPDDDLYPQGVTGGKVMPQDYRSCEYSDEYTKPFGLVRSNYKNKNNEDSQYSLYLTGFDEGTPTDTYQIYELSGNSFIDAATWTELEMQHICETIADNLEGVTYMPFTLKGRGLPYVESGDTLEILTKNNDSITTIVMNHTIEGEQTLTDTYQAV